MTDDYFMQYAVYGDLHLLCVKPASSLSVVFSITKVEMCTCIVVWLGGKIIYQYTWRNPLVMLNCIGMMIMYGVIIINCVLHNIMVHIPVYQSEEDRLLLRMVITPVIHNDKSM